MYLAASNSGSGGSGAPGPRGRVGTPAVIRAAAFRAALRLFLRDSEQIARAHKLTPQRHLLLLMIKGAPDGSGWPP